MLDYIIRHIWDEINNAHKVSLGSESPGFVPAVVGLHIFLAVATLGLGDRTVCDMLRPIKKIFELDAESILEGVFEVAVAIPRAIVYYVILYVRSYILALRVMLWLWVSIIVALLTPLALAIALAFFYGFSTPLSEIGIVEKIVPLSFIPSLAYWYWRFDGRRMALNMKRAWSC